MYNLSTAWAIWIDVVGTAIVALIAWDFIGCTQVQNSIYKGYCPGYTLLHFELLEVSLIYCCPCSAQPIQNCH